MLNGLLLLGCSTSNSIGIGIGMINMERGANTVHGVLEYRGLDFDFKSVQTVAMYVRSRPSGGR